MIRILYQFATLRFHDKTLKLNVKIIKKKILIPRGQIKHVSLLNMTLRGDLKAVLTLLMQLNDQKIFVAQVSIFLFGCQYFW